MYHNVFKTILNIILNHILTRWNSFFRVKACTELNHNLTKKVANLEKQNKWVATFFDLLIVQKSYISVSISDSFDGYIGWSLWPGNEKQINEQRRLDLGYGQFSILQVHF